MWYLMGVSVEYFANYTMLEMYDCDLHALKISECCLRKNIRIYESVNLLVILTGGWPIFNVWKGENISQTF